MPLFYPKVTGIALKQKLWDWCLWNANSMDGMTTKKFIFKWNIDPHIWYEDNNGHTGFIQKYWNESEVREKFNRSFD